ncbi:MAG TPA: hypothetical protein VEF35_03420 [Candidatus Bathyarchaeia archaeon]|nr:hypothetical protein [Candidatus Bathyarchaeia archaeon]
MNNDRAEVDELILEIADYKKSTIPMWLPKNFFGCARPVGELTKYLRDRAHDAWLPDSARQQIRRIVKRILVRL